MLDLEKHVSLPEGHLSAGDADVSCHDGGVATWEPGTICQACSQ